MSTLPGKNCKTLWEIKRLRHHTDKRRSYRSCPRNSTHRASVPPHRHKSTTPFLANRDRLQNRPLARSQIQNKTAESTLTTLRILNPPAKRMVLAILVLQLDVVIIDFHRLREWHGELMWSGGGFDGAAVVVEFDVLDDAEAFVVDVPVDADADAGLGLEEESA
jgi:hypothetical protein